MIQITFAISVINLDPNVLGEISKCEAVSGRQHKLGRHQGAEASLDDVISLHIDMEEGEKNHRLAVFKVAHVMSLRTRCSSTITAEPFTCTIRDTIHGYIFLVLSLSAVSYSLWRPHRSTTSCSSV